MNDGNEFNRPFRRGEKKKSTENNEEKGMSSFNSVPLVCSYDKVHENDSDVNFKWIGIHKPKKRIKLDFKYKKMNEDKKKSSSIFECSSG